MPESLRDFLERYRFSDFALKVVGVGSVGTRCFVIVLQGRDEGDPLILQAKEATESVLEALCRRRAGTPTTASAWSTGSASCRRRRTYSWAGAAGTAGRDFYFRQLWDMKGSVEHDDPQAARPGRLADSAAGRSRAPMPGVATPWRSAAYLGTRDTFDGAIADFAETYADQNEKDHAAYHAAIASGRVSTTSL